MPMIAAEYSTTSNEAVAAVAERRVREAFSAFDEGDKGFLVRDELKPAITACLGYRPTKYEVDVWLRRTGSIQEVSKPVMFDGIVCIGSHLNLCEV